MIDKIRSESGSQEPKPSPAIETELSAPHVSTQTFGRHSLLQITLDNETVARLREPNQHAHVRDEQGNIVGVFKAMPLEDAEFYQYALETVDFDELERSRKDSRPGRTLKEILDELQARAEEECASR